MPTRSSAPDGAPCWVDLATSDTTRARDFYCALFGWTAEEPNPDFGGYFNFSKDGIQVAGGMQSQPGMPEVWSTYLQVSDAGKTVKAAVDAGGSVIVEAMPIGELGTMAVVADVGGAAIGMWQPGAHQGFGLVAEPGAPGWFELYTRDYDASLGFYRDVFGVRTNTMSDASDFRYTTLQDTAAGDDVAGIMDGSGMLPDGVPARWAVYFGVDNTDDAVAKAMSLGGSVVEAAQNSPYGRLATIADSGGTTFKLVGPAPAEAGS